MHQSFHTERWNRDDYWASIHKVNDATEVNAWQFSRRITTAWNRLSRILETATDWKTCGCYSLSHVSNPRAIQRKWTSRNLQKTKFGETQIQVHKKTTEYNLRAGKNQRSSWVCLGCSNPLSSYSIPNLEELINNQPRHLTNDWTRFTQSQLTELWFPFTK